MLELEVKILNMDLGLLEEKIKSLGGVLKSVEKQTNIVIDTRDKKIQKDLDGYLRIRDKLNLVTNEKTSKLTFKKNLKGKKVRENIELDVRLEGPDDKENIIKILELLGYEIVNIGYKDRKTYLLGDIRFDLDKWDEETYPTPYMEIEVKKEEDLQRALDLLEIPKENVSILSIVELKNQLVGK